MLKEIAIFLKIGMILFVTYILYAIIVFILTILIGVPIYLGIQYMNTILTALIQ